MTLTDEHILGIINRYAMGIANANQKEPGFAISAMRRALSDYWPDVKGDQDMIIKATADQCMIKFCHELSAALGIEVVLNAEFLVAQARAMREVMDQMKPELDRIKEQLDALIAAK